MSKKDAKVSGVQLHMPPHVEQFMGALQEWLQKKQGANKPLGSSMFGDTNAISLHEAAKHVGVVTPIVYHQKGKKAKSKVAMLLSIQCLLLQPAQNHKSKIHQ